jgi:hypothetical protein
MIKLCNWCQEEKEHSVRKNGNPASHCKECQREYSKKHYQENKELHNKRRYERRKEERSIIHDYLVELKSSTPCMDCGNIYPYYVMDFDHVRGEKSFNIGNSSNQSSLTRIKEEIEKCDLVCANCHRIRTHQHLDV